MINVIKDETRILRIMKEHNLYWRAGRGKSQEMIYKIET